MSKMCDCQINIYNNIDEDNTISAENIGGGNEIYVDGSNLQFRTLQAGDGIGISQQNDTVTIQNTALGVNSIATSGVGDVSIVQSGTPPQPIMKRLTAGTDISLVDNNTDIIINSIPYSIQNISTAGGNTPQGIYASGNPVFQLKSLKEGPNFTITSSIADLTLQPNLTDTPVSGFSVISQSSGVLKKFLSTSTTLTISDNSNNIFIDTVDLNDEGSAVSLIKNAANNSLYRLSAGNGINLSTNTDEISISTNSINNASNIGTGNQLFEGILNGTARFRTITAGTNISILESAEEIQISSTGSSGGVTSLLNASGGSTAGQSILKVSPSTGDVVIKRLLGGRNISTSSGGLSSVVFSWDINIRDSSFSARRSTNWPVPNTYTNIPFNTVGSPNYAVLPGPYSTSTGLFSVPPVSTGGQMYIFSYSLKLLLNSAQGKIESYLYVSAGSNIEWGYSTVNVDSIDTTASLSNSVTLFPNSLQLVAVRIQFTGKGNVDVAPLSTFSAQKVW